MQVLQLGDQLRFGLKAADEIRLVSIFWQNDLNRYLAINDLLPGAVNCPIGAFTDAF
jgi:hypothetical protein